MPNVLNFCYEPVTLTHPQKGWTYTPDFSVTYFLDSLKSLPGFKGRKGEIYLEIKPNLPSEEYLYVLAEFSRQIPIVLICGSFFTGRFETTLLFKAELNLFTLKHLCPSTTQLNKAVTMAANYRFDLASN